MNEEEAFAAFAAQVHGDEELSETVATMQAGLIMLGVPSILAVQFGDTMWAVAQLAFTLGEKEGVEAIRAKLMALLIEAEGH